LRTLQDQFSLHLLINIKNDNIMKEL